MEGQCFTAYAYVCYQSAICIGGIISAGFINFEGSTVFLGTKVFSFLI